MTRRTTLTDETLVALGAERLAKLVLEEATHNASFKRLVAAAIAGTQGPKAVAAVVDRALAGLERARGFVDWEKRKSFAADLRATLKTITTELGATDPITAVDRLVRYLNCAPAVFERIDDSAGSIQAIFHEAAEAVPVLAARMPDDDRASFVERLIPLLAEDDDGLIQAVVHGTIPLLKPAALAIIDARLADALTAKGSSKATTRSDWMRMARRDHLIRARQAIADQRGDVDGYIAVEGERAEGRQDIIGIAERLLAAGRAAEALDWIRRPARRGIRAMTMADLADGSGGADLTERKRVRLEIDALMALGRKAEAQDLRWRIFEVSLDADILRHYIKHLGDFEEFDTLERAFAVAKAHALAYRTLDFFLAWPRLDLAAALVIEKRETWEGRHYGVLLPAAEALQHDHPVAATILYRTLLDDILERGRSPAYGHGARHLAQLEELSTPDTAAAGLPDHASYRAALLRAHGRKTSFWGLVSNER